MIGAIFEQSDRNAGFSALTVLPGQSYLQPLKTFESAGHVNSISKMAELARAQVRYMRESMPGIPAGGRLIVAHVEREGVYVAPECDLGIERALHQPSPPTQPLHDS